MDIVPCFQPDNEDCPLRRACSLKIALQRAQQAFLAVLDEYSIGDLVAVPGPLRSLLGLASA
jgi:Rrf2 family nitric oxide-sensitive transcriptional repressor